MNLNMKKKTYTQPQIEIYQVSRTHVICTSPPLYDGPLGAPERSDWEIFEDDAFERSSSGDF